MAILQAERVRELLGPLERPVELFVALGPEETPLPGARDVDFGHETVRLVEELASLSDLVTFRVAQEPAGFPRFPSVAVRPEGRDAGVRYDGLPWGHELGSLVGAVVEAGRRESSLSRSSLETLAALTDDRTVDVFVTPACPHCPPMVMLAYKAALASTRVRATAIEATEFPRLAASMDVWSVPHVVVDGAPQWDGAVREHVFVQRLVTPSFG